MIGYMDRRSLITDFAIVAVLLIAGTLVYLAFPGETEAPTTETAPETIVVESEPSVGGEPINPNETTVQNDTEAKLNIEILAEGAGAGIQNGQTAVVHYTGMLTDGSVFDSSVGRSPLTLVLGAGRVIPGWELGLQGMKKGEKRKLTIPPELAYGASGVPGAIPPNATLIFDVEMVEIK